MRSGEDDNINNGADSLLNQMHIAIVGISMVISELEQLTVETPDRLGTMSMVRLSVVDVKQLLLRVFLLFVLDIKLVLAWRIKRKTAYVFKIKSTGQRRSKPGQDKEARKYKGKEQSKMRGCFVRMARRPAELGRSSSSDSSCGLSFLS